jgi:aspartyl aminopeptidase
LRIPTLAIHLTKDRDGFTFNKEEQLVPILSQTAEAELNKPAATVAGSIQDKHHPVMLEMIAKELGCKGILLRVIIGTSGLYYIIVTNLTF